MRNLYKILPSIPLIEYLSLFIIPMKVFVIEAFICTIKAKHKFCKGDPLSRRGRSRLDKMIVLTNYLSYTN